MTLIRKINYWWPTILWALVIFGFSARPSIPTSTIYWQDFAVKKTAHLFVYCVLAVLTYRSLKNTTKFNRLSLLILSLTLVVLYAVTDEFHQTFTPGREPRFRDVVIDTIGASVGLVLVQSGFLKKFLQ